MSSLGLPAPIVAPWAAEYRAYPTQILPFPRVDHATLQISIPAGQWWRPIYTSAAYSTSAVAGSRVARFTILNAAGAFVFDAIAALVQPGSTFYRYNYVPNASGYTNTTIQSASVILTPIPDLVWQYGYKIAMTVAFADASDDWLADPTLAVETFTENAQGELVPTVEPIPSPIPA